MRHLILLTACLPLTVWATDEPSIPTPEPPKQSQAQNQAQEQGQSQSASSNQSQSQGNVQTMESERQVPATFAIAPQATAPCRYSQGRAVGTGVIGGGWSQSKRDEDCWSEYVKQAEHERAMDEAKLALERDKLAFQREQAQTRQQCSDIATRSLTACNAGEK